MDSFRAYYEYPSSQAAIHALPSRNVSNGTANKSKRSWGNILRMTGLSKKERDDSPSKQNSQASIYSPGFSLPQGNVYAAPTYASPYGTQTYATPTYAVPQNHFISNTPYREPGRISVPERRENYSGYNATYGRSSVSPVIQVANSPNGSGKNTVRYTDWFGSVVGKKSPIRPSLPMLHNSTTISGENNLPTVTSWDNYVSIQSPTAPVGIPAIVPLSNYSNVCICPDQLFSTRSKKKKKCKQCGRKYATMKYSTAIGSVSKFRPALPPNFYQSPTAIWAWPQPTPNSYSQQYIVSSQSTPALSYLERERDGDSPPPTPETIKSSRSGRSNGSSSSTLKQDRIGVLKAIPPPPTVPLPSIPISLDSEKANERKKSTIIEARSSAYDIMEEEHGLVVSSDTDDLSDNAVHDPWEATEHHSKQINKNTEKNKIEKGPKQVSVISIGGISHNSPKNSVKVVSPSNQQTNKVRIYTTQTSEKIKNKAQDSLANGDVNKPLQLNNGVIKVSNDSFCSPKGKCNASSSKSRSFQYDWNNAILLSNQSLESQRNITNNSNNFNPESSHNSSQVKKRNKYNNALRDNLKEKQNLNGTSELVDRDKSKIISIAGQRILLDHRMNYNGDKKSDLNQRNRIFGDRELDSEMGIGEWEPLNEEIVSGSLNEKEPNLNGFSEVSLCESVGEEYQINRKGEKLDKLTIPKNNYSFKSIDHKWNIRSPDIRDTIHEEDEEYDDEDEEDVKGKNNPSADNGSSEPKTNGVAKSNLYLQEDGDKDTNSSSGSSPVRGDCFQPSLSELLQVKSILKRPNSLDTSSETDSDFYLPTFSEYKQNARKKKSVQFRQSHEVNLVEDMLETKGRKVSSIKSIRRDRERRKEKLCNGKPNGVTEVVISDLDSVAKTKDIVCGKIAEKYHNNWDSMGKESGTNGVENSAVSTAIPPLEHTDVDLDRGLAETIVINTPTNIATEGSATGLRRSHSHRQTFDVSTPKFNDTYRLRQASSRPSILLFDDSELRRPTRKAPPPPRNSSSPLRPTVPPPPPPPPIPPRHHDRIPAQLESDLNNDLIASQDGRNSPSSSTSSLSPPSSPPPPLPSSPPPLPTSSPPPLYESDSELSSPEITFSSFKDPLSSVSVSSKMLQITPNSHDLSNRQICSALPTTRNSSMFESSEGLQTATIRGRVASTASGLTSFQALNGSRDSLNVVNNKADIERSPDAHRGKKSPQKRSSFLSSMVEEGDQEERFSDHIYEELPSLNSSQSGSNGDTPSPERSMFDGASKYEILEYLQDARNRVNIADDDNEEISNLSNLAEQLENMRLEDEEDANGLDSQDDPLLPSRYMDERSSNRSSNSESSENSAHLRSDKERLAVGEIERTDSGVGSETSKPNISVRRPIRGETSSSAATGGQSELKEGDLPPCDDCDSPVEARVTNSGLMFAPLVCRRCSRRRQERKEILTEIMETEVKYGRDLRVMMEQFNRPMKVAGLLSKIQLDKIFLNVEDLIEHNRQFALQIKDAFEIALEQGDEDLLTVNVAKLFLQAGPMLHAFQNYCVRQGGASILLQSLEKERELFRIFLKVSQMENTLLRRMNLHSFLMVPVQRVTKYPLLLARLYKATPPSHSSREDCRRAREKIEIYLQHINNETKETSPTKLWRRISMSVGNNGPSKWSPSTPPDCDTSMKLRNVVLEVLDWNTNDAYIVREGRLLCLPPESSNWTRRGRGFKMATVQMVLVTLGTPRTSLEEEIPEDGLVTPRDLGIKEAAILAFKDHRLTRTALIREPWILSKVVVTWDAEGETECFELTDLATKETFIFKDRECVGTEEWFRSIQFHALSVGSWRRRRSALANIMINGARRS